MSHMSREDMLRELELLPVWQLRQPLPTPFKIEPPVVDDSALVLKQQEVEQQQPAVTELAVIDIALAESIETESSVSAPLIAESALSALPEFPIVVTQEIEAVDAIEIAPALPPVLVQALPLRLLLSEDSTYAFLMEPYAGGTETQETETLLRNMIRAMQASCRVDVIDSTDKIFAVHTPRLIISLGAEPANRLLGKTHMIDEWRNMQHEQQPCYENIPVVVTYHPAHLLQNLADKAHAWRDLCLAMKLGVAIR